MRIISNFRDYYDSALAYGADKSLVYDRKSNTITYTEQTYPFPLIKLSQWGWHAPTIFSKYIGFCGKIYPILKISCTNPDYDYHHLARTPETIHQICYNIDDVDQIVKMMEKKYQNIYYSQKPRKYKPNHYNFVRFTRYKCEEFFKYNGNHTNLFFEHKVPIFVAYSGWKYTGNSIGDKIYNIDTNINLSKYNFPRIFDAYSAFQEISMYLGGVLGVGSPTVPEIDNDTLLQAKGFDLKTSFRKDKS